MRQGLTRGTKIRITSGIHRGRTGTVEAQVFQKTVDYPDEMAHGFHATMDDGTWVTVRQEQVMNIITQSHLNSTSDPLCHTDW